MRAPWGILLMAIVVWTISTPAHSGLATRGPLAAAPQEYRMPASMGISTANALTTAANGADATDFNPMPDIGNLALGASHACALTVGGAVKCWGDNRYGQLGDGMVGQQGLPMDVVGLGQGVRAISAGEDHTCAVTIDGAAKCWGNNRLGQLGNGTTTASSTPVSVMGLTSGVQTVSAGYGFTCAVMVNGGVKCWGNNSYGQLGDGSTVQRTTPVDVVGLASGARAITIGYYHTCVTTTEDGSKCWGNNWFGQLGDGTRTNRHTPVNVVGLANGVRTTTAGGYFTCATMMAGSVKCWGDNEHYQLGDGTTNQRSVPGDVLGIPEQASAIGAGGTHACITTAEGAVMCWGDNRNGQLGDGTTIQRTTPVQVAGLNGAVQTVVSGYGYTCALHDTGVAQCWGLDANGQLGRGAITQRPAPVPWRSLTGEVAAFAGRSSHECAVMHDGRVMCWGNNRHGQIGDGTTLQRGFPVGVTGLDSHAQSVVLGSFHTCALTQGGGVKCWGSNMSGQLGDGTTSDRHTPVDVVGLTNGVLAITAGGSHTCALLENGAVKCWGDNSSGQLGDGTTTDRTTPVAVIGLTDIIQTVSAGGSHTCALTTNGAVKCWGASGMLGNGSSGVPSLIPVSVTGLASGVQSVVAGGTFTCALTSNHGVKCWGGNFYGQLGNGANIWGYTPVDVVGLTEHVTALSLGIFHACAMTSAGNQCWGQNAWGQLGDGSTIDRNTPAPVIGLMTEAASISAGGFHTFSIGDDGSVQCWGLDQDGQLGLGTATIQLVPSPVVEARLIHLPIIRHSH